MLHHLQIRNFAIVDAIDIELKPGMTVITGETGAGKSLLVDALHLLLGGRADKGLVRSGAKEATVSGLFSLGKGAHSRRVRETLEQAGISLQNGEELLVRRTIAKTGRGRVYINDVLVTVATLAQAMDGVVDIMGQHEHQSLSSQENQLELLDAFGVHDKRRQALAQTYDKVRSLLLERDKLATGEAEKTSRMEFLAFQMEELSGVEPKPGELSELEAQRKKLGSVDRLRQNLGRAEALLYSNERSACTQISEALVQLKQAVEVSPDLRENQRSLEEANTLVTEVARELGRSLSRLEADPQRLEQVEDRIDALRQLMRKHRVEADQLPELLLQLQKEYHDLENSVSRLAELDSATNQAKQQLATEARALTEARHQAARKLGRKCAGMLGELAMAAARIEIKVANLADRDDKAAIAIDDGEQRRVVRSGADRVDILLQANPGEPARPMTKVASGGELSRVALAMRRALADRDPVPTYIFDEVDAAIGGATAEAVGLALKTVAGDHQVVCISHLPQVAALADQHLQVSKKVQGKSTSASVLPLNKTQRVDEIARMLGGTKSTATAKKHARVLLQGPNG